MTVLVRSRNPVLRRQTVVDGDHDALRLGAEVAEEVVVTEPGGGAEAEASAMEVEDDGEGRRIGGLWEEDPGGDGFQGIDDDIFGFASFGENRRRWCCLRGEPIDLSVGKDLHESRDFRHNRHFFVVGGGCGDGGGGDLKALTVAMEN